MSPSVSILSEKSRERREEHAPLESLEEFAEIFGESYPNAKRLGRYWNTTVYRRVIAFERELFQLMQGLVREGRITLRELSRMLDADARTIDWLILIARRLSAAEWLESSEPKHILAKFLFRATYPYYANHDIEKGLAWYWHGLASAGRTMPPEKSVYLTMLGLDRRSRKRPLYGQWVVNGFGDDILLFARALARQGNRFMEFSPEYWKNSEWVLEEGGLISEDNETPEMPE